jgi:hypothetical protein
LSVHNFVFEHALRHGHRALPVVEGGRLLGIVSITDAKHLPHDAWATTPVGEVMTHMPLKTLAPEADLSAALDRRHDQGRVDDWRQVDEGSPPSTNTSINSATTSRPSRVLPLPPGPVSVTSRTSSRLSKSRSARLSRCRPMNGVDWTGRL